MPGASIPREIELFAKTRAIPHPLGLRGLGRWMDDASSTSSGTCSPRPRRCRRRRRTRGRPRHGDAIEDGTRHAPPGRPHPARTVWASPRSRPAGRSPEAERCRGEGPRRGWPRAPPLRLEHREVADARLVEATTVVDHHVVAGGVIDVSTARRRCRGRSPAGPAGERSTRQECSQVHRREARLDAESQCGVGDSRRGRGGSCGRGSMHVDLRWLGFECATPGRGRRASRYGVVHGRRRQPVGVWALPVEHWRETGLEGEMARPRTETERADRREAREAVREARRATKESRKLATSLSGRNRLRMEVLTDVAQALTRAAERDVNERPRRARRMARKAAAQLEKASVRATASGDAARQALAKTMRRSARRPSNGVAPRRTAQKMAKSSRSTRSQHPSPRPRIRADREGPEAPASPREVRLLTTSPILRRPSDGVVTRIRRAPTCRPARGAPAAGRRHDFLYSPRTWSRSVRRA